MIPHSTVLGYRAVHGHTVQSTSSVPAIVADVRLLTSQSRLLVTFDPSSMDGSSLSRDLTIRIKLI
jgi:hypothetical protein